MSDNTLNAGVVDGTVVQAGTITGDVHVHAPRPIPTPRQLPANPAGFVGRVAEQAMLTAADGGGAVLISALAGAGGIGKTWLALHWAHQHLDRFPDGQLFIDLRGFSPGSTPVPASEAVHGFLSALGIDLGTVPAEPDAQIRLYRSLVAGKRMLIMLDNAASDEQVEPLLPGSGSCTVLVTSRRVLTALTARHGARHVPLGSQDPTEARALVAERLAGDPRVTAEPDAVTELVALCGHYPLALTIMAARAQVRPGVPLAEFAGELRHLGLAALNNARNPAASLPAVLSLSLRDLTEPERRLFALLGIAPGADLPLPAVISLFGTSETNARDGLEALEEVSLIERWPGGRYAMHDLIKAFGATTAAQLPAIERNAALRRIVDFYTHTASISDDVLTPYRQSIVGTPEPPVHVPAPIDAITALAWFDDEHTTLLAAQRIAVDHAWHTNTWQLGWALDTYHRRRGHLRARHVAGLAALAAAEHLPEPRPRIRAGILIGRACIDLGRDQDGIESLTQALALAEQHRLVPERADCHRWLGWALWHCRHPNTTAGMAHITRALDLYRSLTDSVGEAIALNAMAWQAARSGAYTDARAHGEAALAINSHHNNPAGRAAILENLGYIARHTGDHPGTIDYYQQALDLHRTLGDTAGSATNLDDLGHIYAAEGHPELAQAAWQEALALYHEQGRVADIERVRRELETVSATTARRPPEPSETRLRQE